MLINNFISANSIYHATETVATSVSCKTEAMCMIFQWCRVIRVSRSTEPGHASHSNHHRDMAEKL